MILAKDSDIFFQINFSICKLLKIHVFAFKMGFSFEKKSPGKGTPLFSFQMQEISNTSGSYLTS